MILTLKSPHLRVLATILIIATVYYSVTFFRESKQWSRDKQRMSDVAEMVDTIYMYELTNHKYPTSLSELVPEYMSEIPSDPSTNQPYPYRIIPETGQFELCTIYESSKAKKLGLEACAISKTK